MEAMETMVIAQTTQGEVMMTIKCACEMYGKELANMIREKNPQNVEMFMSAFVMFLLATGKIRKI